MVVNFLDYCIIGPSLFLVGCSLALFVRYLSGLFHRIESTHRIQSGDIAGLILHARTIVLVQHHHIRISPSSFLSTSPAHISSY